ADRGLYEPVITPPPPEGYGALLADLLARPNICSREWINRQYDHEVQGTSVIKPFVGVNRDIPADAAVLRPVLTSDRGLAVAQAISPAHSAMDAYAMTALVMDEALRRVVAVGADPDTVGGVDNFCWPTIQYDPKTNPDGKHKAAQLVRSCLALKELCLAWGIPLLSGKDSMYVDGHLEGPYGERRKVSGPESLQFTATAIVPDVFSCQTLDAKFAGDLVYILGETKNELGGSEYYEHFGFIGTNAPWVTPGAFLTRYRALHRAISVGLCAGVHGLYRGGLGVHLALAAMAGGLGISADLSRVPRKGADRDDTILFSESAGRFLVFVAPENQKAFEGRFGGMPFARIGEVTAEPVLSVTGLSGAVLIQKPLAELSTAWKSTFGGLA
ncbi:MAG: AIR synthase-related protein, partial [Pseudomonadota bacterium]